MAKMKKSRTAEKPLWLKYTEEEVKQIILKLSNKGMTAEKIGLVLRDQYGIPKVKLFNIKIGKVLKENNKFEEPTNKNLKSKLSKILAHDKKFKNDRVCQRSIILTKAKLKKREEYRERI